MKRERGEGDGERVWMRRLSLFDKTRDAFRALVVFFTEFIV